MIDNQSDTCVWECLHSNVHNFPNMKQHQTIRVGITWNTGEQNRLQTCIKKDGGDTNIFDHSLTAFGTPL